MSYTFGRPVAIPETIVGEKDDAAVYLSVTTQIKLLLRCPDDSQAGGDVAAEDFEPELRRRCAHSLRGIVVGPYWVESACVQEFEPAD